MKFFLLASPFLLLASCTIPPMTEAPLGLADAILTLPSEAIAGMSPEGRREYLDNPSGDFDEAARRLHLFGDGPDVGGDPESMLFLRLFEDADGRTVAATHSARPFADGRDPNRRDTFVFRFESGKWVDITDSVLPPGVSRDWWFRFGEPGTAVPCGSYERFPRRDGRGNAYRFGEGAGAVSWHDDRFLYEPKSG